MLRFESLSVWNGMMSRRGRLGQEPTSAARLLSILMLGIAATGILAGCGASGSGGSGAGGGIGAPRQEQVQLQSSIVDARKHLFDGVLSYPPLSPIQVEDTRRFDVTLFAVGQNAEGFEIPEGYVVGSRSLRVGGVEEAKLSSASDKLAISAVGSTRRLLGQIGDKAEWTWDITPKEPGEYKLDLVIMTYQGTTDNPLYVINPPISVNLTVTNTWSHRFKSMMGWINWFYISIGAIAGILVFFREQVLTPLKNLRKRARTTSNRDYDDLD